MRLSNGGSSTATFILDANAYFFGEHMTVRVRPDEHKVHAWSLRRSGHWYDFTAKVEELPGFARRFAGRVETGRDGYSDPAMGGFAVGTRS